MDLVTGRRVLVIDCILINRKVIERVALHLSQSHYLAIPTLLLAPLLEPAIMSSQRSHPSVIVHLYLHEGAVMRRVLPRNGLGSTQHPTGFDSCKNPRGLSSAFQNNMGRQALVGICAGRRRVATRKLESRRGW